MTKAQANPDAELADLVSAGEVVRAGGRDVIVRPFSPRQLPKVLQAFEPLQSLLGAGIDLKKIDGAALGKLAMDHTEHVVQFIAAATREDPDFIGDGIDMAELLALFGAVMKVNADFFMQRVVPALLKVVTDLPSLNRPGQT